MTDYFECALRKGRPQIASDVCKKQRCLFLTSENGELKCGYDDPNLPQPPRVNKPSRDGVS
jgi:hypothetical protein